MNWSSFSPFISCCLYRSASLLVLTAISAAAFSAVTLNSIVIFAMDLSIACLPSAFPVLRPGTHRLQILSTKESIPEAWAKDKAEVEVEVEEEVEEEV